VITVYLATSGEYSDYRVQHVFTRREDAESYALGENVEERELQEGPVEVRDWHQLTWWPGKPDREGDSNRVGNPFLFTSKRDFDGREGHVQHSWPETLETYLRVEGWDLERVRKTYSEQRAMHIASRTGTDA
jgi:hypothetical protein